MGKYKEENGKTRVGAFLETVAPDILEIAGDLTGVGALEKLGKMLSNDNIMSEEKLKSFKMKSRSSGLKLILSKSNWNAKLTAKTLMLGLPI